MDAGQYEEAIVLFEKLGDYKDSAEKAEAAALEVKKAAQKAAEEARIAAKEKANADAYAEAEALLAAGVKAHAAMKFGSAAGYKDTRERSFELWDELAKRDTVSAGDDHIVGFKADGTVVAGGNNGSGRSDVSDWTDIVAVSAGYYYTVGLKADGTVVAVGGNNGNSRSDVSDWTDIVTVSTGWNHTVCLKADGTVVAVGGNYGQSDVSDWSGIKLPKQIKTNAK